MTRLARNAALFAALGAAIIVGYVAGVAEVDNERQRHAVALADWLDGWSGDEDDGGVVVRGLE